MSSRRGSTTDRGNDVSPEPAKPRRRSSLKQSSEPASPGSTGSRRPSFRRSSISVEREEDKLARLERERIAAEEAVAEAAKVEDQKAVALAEHEKERDTAVAKAMNLGILETPLEAARITLRMYTHRQSVFRAHSFLVGNESGGLSEQLGRIPIQAKRTTLEMLRSLIETTVDNNMMRRNPIYQEFLVTVLNLPNPYKYTAKELRHYRFGYFARPEDKFPTMIPYGAESELLAAESVVNFITDDLIMVPRSQLRPDDSFPSPEDQAIGR